MSDGSVYEGSFQNDLISGVGTFLWTDGKIYNGDWLNN